MISFNVPPFVGNELKYIEEAVRMRKICGDGTFTKKCSKWLEKQTGRAKVLLTTSCTHATEMAAILSDIECVYFARCPDCICRYSAGYNEY